MDREPNAASVAIIEGNKVLLIERARAPYANLWTLPGGRREPNETAEQCAIREVREELGIAIRNPLLITTNSVREISGQNWRLAVFLATDFEGLPRPSDEVANHRWVTFPEIAGLPTTPGLQPILEIIFRVQQMRAEQ